MATKMAPPKSAAHEKAEAVGLKSGKLSIGGYMKAEKKEGEKASLKTAVALKTGKMSPATYAKQEAKGKK